MCIKHFLSQTLHTAYYITSVYFTLYLVGKFPFGNVSNGKLRRKSIEVLSYNRCSINFIEQGRELLCNQCGCSIKHPRSLATQSMGVCFSSNLRNIQRIIVGIVYRLQGSIRTIHYKILCNRIGFKVICRMRKRLLLRTPTMLYSVRN